MHGAITFSTNGGSGRLRMNMELPAGASITTGAETETYLQVNGKTSTIKVTENTTLELTKMDYQSTLFGKDTETVLTVKYGTILGSVRKLSANSSYMIHTPNGSAAVRGTDFQITATAFQGGVYAVTYACVTGQLIVTATVDGKEISQTLQTGQSWTPGKGDVKHTPIWDGGGVYYPTVIDLPPPPPPALIQPFHGNGPPNTAVDIGRNPYIRGPPPPPPPPPVPAHH